MTERRAFIHEFRAKGRQLDGYAALFGIEARIGEGMIETIMPGAFSAFLASGRDVLALADHDPRPRPGAHEEPHLAPDRRHSRIGL